MNRRDFLCGASCLMAGFLLGKMGNFPVNNKTIYEDVPFKFYDDQLRNILVNVASHCNLNCKGCCTFSSIAKPELLTANQFETDFTKFKEVLGNCNSVSLLLQGGEPLLNPEINEIIKISRKLFPKGNHILSTNAIGLISKDEEFWKIMNKNRIGLNITQYPININRAIYEEKAEKYNIKINYQFVESNKLYDLSTRKPIHGVYRKYGFPWGKTIIDLKGTQDASEKFRICPCCGVKTTYARGNLYYCYTGAFIKSFIDYFNLDIKITKDDYIKIGKIKDIQELYDFFSGVKPICKYCKYCLTTQYGKPGIDWGFTKKELSEWTE